MELFTEHVQKDHLLARVDARLKLMASLMLLGMILSYHGFALPLFAAALCLIVCRAMRVPLKLFALRFSEPLFIIVMLLVLKVFFSGKTVLFSLDIFGLTLVGYEDGLREGLLIGVRIIGAVSVVALVGFSTPFTEFMAGLSWFRIPRGFVEILMFAYRYIFVLLEDGMVIYNAQKNRLGYSTLRRGMRSFGTLTGSLTLKAFESSQNIAVAMLQRGYDGSMPMLKAKPFKALEVAFSILFVLAMGFLWKI